MVEYVIIAVAVLAAALFTGRYLWREAKEGRCAHCNCASKDTGRIDLVQIQMPDRTEPRHPRGAGR